MNILDEFGDIVFAHRRDSGNCGCLVLQRGMLEAGIIDGETPMSTFRRGLFDHGSAYEEQFTGSMYTCIAVRRDGSAIYPPSYSRRGKAEVKRRQLFHRDVLQSIWTEGIDFDNEVPQKFWMDAVSVLPIAVHKYAIPRVVVYQLLSVTASARTCVMTIYSYENGKVVQHIQRGFEAPNSNDINVILTPSAEFALLRVRHG